MIATIFSRGNADVGIRSISPSTIMGILCIYFILFYFILMVMLYNK